ncbi:hypothetical protein KPL47_22950 [Clostridium estertheticum]|nr:hypothetical protein [Clostridium estertheticum]MBU3179156.1 hypothetical protein [Clostridium estertheticum]
MKAKGTLALLMVLWNLGAERKTCEKLASIFLQLNKNLFERIRCLDYK